VAVDSLPLLIPNNAFSFGHVTLNRKRGTATLAVTVPGPGTLLLTGNGVKHAHETVPGKGTFALAAEPAGNALKQLKRTGHATIKLSVTYVPTGGKPRTKDKTLRLIRQ
jgi:hypothetical protein